jgi:hypothetical protein
MSEFYLSVLSGLLTFQRIRIFFTIYAPVPFISLSKKHKEYKVTKIFFNKNLKEMSEAKLRVKNKNFRYFDAKLRFAL